MTTGDLGDELIQAVAETIADATSAELVRVEGGPTRPPRRLDAAARSVLAAFTATPDCARQSWVVARHVERHARPGDIVLLSDRDGRAAVSALESWTAAPSDRCPIVVVAGASRLLEWRLVAGSAGPFDVVEEDDAIDWERTAYHNAHLVLAPAPAVQQALAGEGIPSVLVTLRGSTPTSTRMHRPVRGVALPEPVSRRARTPQLVRAIARSTSAPAIWIPPTTTNDRIWQGTTLEAFGDLFHAVPVDIRTVDRSKEDPDLLILGDPYALPAALASDLRRRGVPALVPAGSVAATAWPDADEWRTPQDVTSAVDGQRRQRHTTPLESRFELPPGRDDPERVRAVTVAVPVYRDVRFLDECLASVLAQTCPPVEILLVDDGSRSDDVTHALTRWRSRDARIRVLTNTVTEGVSVARNVAMEAATADAIFFIDQDDVAEPDLLERCAAVLRARPDVVAVATWTRFFGAYEGIEAKPVFDQRSGRRHNTIVSTAVLLDMEIRRAGIRFEEDLAWVYCEDWDLWSQIVAAGGRMGLVPRPLVRHRVHPSSGGHRRTRLALGAGAARARRRLAAVAQDGPLSPELG